jgi:hypothetical protein
MLMATYRRLGGFTIWAAYQILAELTIGRPADRGQRCDAANANPRKSRDSPNTTPIKGGLMPACVPCPPRDWADLRRL